LVFVLCTGALVSTDVICLSVRVTL